MGVNDENIDRLPRILCIDDEEAFLEGLKRHLEKLPARVNAARDGDVAMDQLIDAAGSDDPYKLLILDKEVPRKRDDKHADPDFGRDLLIEQQRWYQLLPAGTPVIVYTNYPSYESCVECMRAGAFDYIPKIDTATGRSNLSRLTKLCNALLYPEPKTDTLTQWMEQHYEALVGQYGGKFVALIDQEIATRSSIDAPTMGGKALLSAESFEEVRRRMLRDKLLRWVPPEIIAVPTER